MGTRGAKVLEALDSPKRSDNEMKNHIQKMGERNIRSHGRFKFLGQCMEFPPVEWEQNYHTLYSPLIQV